MLVCNVKAMNKLQLTQVNFVGDLGVSALSLAEININNTFISMYLDF